MENPSEEHTCAHECVCACLCGTGRGRFSGGVGLASVGRNLAAKGSAGGRGGCSGHECGADVEDEWRVQLAFQPALVAAFPKASQQGLASQVLSPSELMFWLGFLILQKFSTCGSFFSGRQSSNHCTSQNTETKESNVPEASLHLR